MSPNPVTCERLGKIASQLSVGVEELETFAARQLDEIDALDRRLAGGLQVRHPHRDDPVVAAVLEQFAQLESKL